MPASGIPKDIPKSSQSDVLKIEAEIPVLRGTLASRASLKITFTNGWCWRERTAELSWSKDRTYHPCRDNQSRMWPANVCCQTPFPRPTPTSSRGHMFPIEIGLG